MSKGSTACSKSLHQPHRSGRWSRASSLWPMLLQIAEPEGFGQKGKRKKDAKTAAGQKLPAKRPATGDPAQRNAAITNFFKSADGVPACLFEDQPWTTMHCSVSLPKTSLPGSVQAAHVRSIPRYPAVSQWCACLPS